MKKQLCFLVSVCLAALLVLFAAALRYLGVSYTPEICGETAAALDNPHQGFYVQKGFTLCDTPSDDAALADFRNGVGDVRLYHIQINLKNYADRDLTDTALSQLDHIFTVLSQDKPSVMVRFLYDWDGIAQETEPRALSQIQRHMEQVAPVVNAHSDCIYLLQGLFVGNCGELHSSRFSDYHSMSLLANTLLDCISPDIYLSVRTPAQWRQIMGCMDMPDYPDRASADPRLLRMGLFNDGMMASETDLGTYGETPFSQASEPGFSAPREEELAFQERLCRFVPNGGEVVYDTAYNNFKAAVNTLRTMHVSYLNLSYDETVLNKWKNSVWQEDGVFDGMDGFTYIERHLGYRYALTGTELSFRVWTDSAAVLSVTLSNSGFGNALRPYSAGISVVNAAGEICETVPVGGDLRDLRSGTEETYSVSVPVRDLPSGEYTLYLSVTDPSSEREIALANTNPHTEHGYALGGLVLQRAFS